MASLLAFFGPCPSVSCAPLVLRLGVDLLLLLLLPHLVSICGWNVGKGYSQLCLLLQLLFAYFCCCPLPRVADVTLMNLEHVENQ